MVMFWFVDDQCPHWLSTGDSSKSPPSTRPMEEESERKKKKKKSSGPVFVGPLPSQQ
jgi:hypothetical protein